MKSTRALFVLLALIPAIGCSRGHSATVDNSPVTILRDRWGIAHVRAADEAGAFLGAGYAMAEDRMLQMTLRRRIVQGRLAEILGAGKENRVLLSDRKYRILGLYRQALRRFESLTPEARRCLDAFSAGVNLYLERGSLSPLFARYGGRPEPWHPADSLALWDLFAERFTTGWDSEHEAARKSIGQPPPSLVPKAEWPNPDDSSEIVSAEDFRRASPQVYERFRKSALTRRKARAAAGFPGLEIKASHNWVVSGPLSATGSPILESDPQLTVESPSFGYEIHLEGGRLNARGLCFPGAPAIWIGFNRSCAWGVTALGGDNADLFAEQIDPKDPSRYRWKEEWRKFESRTEEIRIKGSPTVSLEVRTSLHGPIVNELLAGMPAAPPYALQMRLISAPTASLESAMKMMGASDWPAFRRTLSGIAGPALHLIFGDVRGNIAYQTMVQTPKRSELSLMPREGWSGRDEWEMIPFDELPTLFNPARGFIFTANHLAAGSWYPYPVGVARGDGPRSLRLRELLQAGRKYSVEDFLRIHRDSVNPVVRDFAVLAVALAEEGAVSEPELKAGIEMLRRWDSQLLTDSPGYLMGVGILLALQENMTGTWIMGYGGSWPGLCLMFKDAMRSFESSRKVPPDPKFRAWIKEKLVRALELSRSANPLTSIPFVHRMPYQEHGLGIGSLAPEFDLESLPLRSPVVQTIWSQAGTMYVQIVDLRDVDRSLSVMPPGLSENPASPHFRDQIGLWAEGALHPAPLTRAAVDRFRQSEMVLTYEGSAGGRR